MFSDLPKFHQRQYLSHLQPLDDGHDSDLAVTAIFLSVPLVALLYAVLSFSVALGAYCIQNSEIHGKLLLVVLFGLAGLTGVVTLVFFWHVWRGPRTVQISDEDIDVEMAYGWKTIFQRKMKRGRKGVGKAVQGVGHRLSRVGAVIADGKHAPLDVEIPRIQTPSKAVKRPRRTPWPIHARNRPTIIPFQWVSPSANVTTPNSMPHSINDERNSFLLPTSYQMAYCLPQYVLYTNSYSLLIFTSTDLKVYKKYTLCIPNDQLGLTHGFGTNGWILTPVLAIGHHVPQNHAWWASTVFLYRVTDLHSATYSQGIKHVILDDLRLWFGIEKFVMNM